MQRRGDVAAQFHMVKTTDTGTFVRYVPFDDERVVVVRRGHEMGHSHGLEKSRRFVTVSGRELPLVRFRAILSPPPLHAGASLSEEAARRYQPESEVLFLPDAEVVLRREPDGFSDREVEVILGKISLSRRS